MAIIPNITNKNIPRKDRKSNWNGQKKEVYNKYQEFIESIHNQDRDLSWKQSQALNKIYRKSKVIINVHEMIEDHIRYKYPEYDWNADPLSLTLLGSNIHNRIYPNTDPGWSKEKWIAFYNAIKPFMEEEVKK